MRCRCHLRARASLRNRHLGPSIMGSEDEAEQPGFQSDPLEAVGGVPQNLQQGCRFARYLHFLHDPARVIHNADAGLLDRYVQSSKMVHAALLLLMLEAVTTDLVFTISLKRSTQNLQLSTSWAGRLPHLCPGISDINLFRYCQGVINFDAEISDRAFDLGREC